MPRHHAVLVHNQLSSQLKAGFLKQPPPAYPALINFPPSPTPLLQPVSDRSSFDLLPTTRHDPRLRPLPITYEARDKLRRAFFRDHPIEAYRPKNLVEDDIDFLNHKSTADHVRKIKSDGTIGGPDDTVGLDQWTQLAQRTLLPSPEDCIDFAYALHYHHPARYTLNLAYSISVSQFRTLRFEDEIRRSFARQEAEYHGAIWSRDRLARQDELQKRWIADTEGLKIKHTSGPSKNLSQNTHSTSGQNQIGLFGGPRRGDQQANFEDGKHVLKEVQRKSKRLRM